MKLTLRSTLAFLLYIAAVILPNLLIQWFGIIDFAPGSAKLEAPAAVLAVGLALVARDMLHETAGLIPVIAAIAVGTILSAALASPQIALASGVAFVLAELLDLLIYQRIRNRAHPYRNLRLSGWAPAALASSYVAAGLDSVVFLYLAFGSMQFLPGQWLGKSVAITVVVVVVMPLRPLWAPQRAVPAV